MHFNLYRCKAQSTSKFVIDNRPTRKWPTVLKKVLGQFSAKVVSSLLTYFKTLSIGPAPIDFPIAPAAAVPKVLYFKQCFFDYLSGRPSGQQVGLAIHQSLIRVPLWPLLDLFSVVPSSKPRPLL